MYLSGACALALGVAVALIPGCPAAMPGDGGGDGGGDGDGGGTTSRFAGADTCQACHPGDHSTWMTTRHATALETLEGIGQGENEGCLGCHTVGFGESDGFTSREATPNLAGVQCENCHGPAADHAANPGDATLRPTINQASTLCGECHTGAHHATFDEWNLSKHSTAIATLQTNTHASDSCLNCHSQDYRSALAEAANDDSVEVPTLATAQLSIECATCHDPHDDPVELAQLRATPANLCGECHTQGEQQFVEGTPHHPQLEMLTGTGAFAEDGTTLTLGDGENSTHSTLAADGGQACAQCHVIKHEVEEPNEGNPNVTGHTFNPFDESIVAHQAEQYTGCAACHTSEVADALRTAQQTDIEARLVTLAAIFDDGSGTYIDPAGLTEDDQARLNVARFNYLFVNADGSRGVHNPTYAETLLMTAETIVADLTP